MFPFPIHIKTVHFHSFHKNGTKKRENICPVFITSTSNIMLEFYHLLFFPFNSTFAGKNSTLSSDIKCLVDSSVLFCLPDILYSCIINFFGVESRILRQKVLDERYWSWLYWSINMHILWKDMVEWIKTSKKGSRIAGHLKWSQSQ